MDAASLSAMIESVKVAPLRPGDVVVVRLALPHVSNQMSEQIREHLREFFGENKVLVFAQDADIEIVRPEATA